MRKKRVKSLRKKLRAISVLVLLRAVLKGEYDGDVKWTFKEVPEKNDKVTISFEINLLDTDIVFLQNLSDEKVNGVLVGAKSLIGKYCKLWDKKWWEKLGAKKPSKSDGGNDEKVA